MTDWRSSRGTKPPQCAGCPRQGAGFYPGVGPPDAKIRGIGRSPDIGGIYSAEADRLLDGILDRAGLSRNEIYLTNLVKCYAKGEPTGASIAFCMKQYMVDELPGAKALVAMGSLPAQFIAGVEKVKKERGTVQDGPGGIPVVVSLEPAGLIWSRSQNKNEGGQRDYLPIVIKDWIKAKRIAQGVPNITQDRVFVRDPSPGEIATALDRIKGVYGLDIETNYEEDGVGRTITHIGIAPEIGYAMSIHPRPENREMVERLLANPNLTMVGQNNGQFDSERLIENGYTVRNKLFDTMLADHLVESDMGDYGLEAICSRFLDYKPWKHQKNVDRDIYNCTDVANTLELYPLLTARMDDRLTWLYWRHQAPMAKVCAKMKRDGLKFDQQAALNARVGAVALIETYEKAVNDALGMPFNWRSNSQMKSLLYDVLKMPVQLHRRTRKPTVDHHALEDLLEKTGSKLIKTVLELRKLDKLQGTFLAGSDVCADGRVHPDWMQHRTVTGRLSSLNPNAQQIPKGICRSVIVPDSPDDIFIEADASQIEMRLSAWFSGCKTLQDRLTYYDANPKDADGKRQDVHRLHANKFYRDTGLDETKRSLSKNMFYGVSYGQGAHGLSIMYDVEEVYAKSFINFLWSEYPELLLWRQGLLNAIDECQHLRNPFGRIRWLWNRAFATEAYIFLPQGTGADVLYEWALEIVERLIHPARIVLLCHDSIMVHCPAEMRDEVSALMKDVMNRPIPMLDNLVIPAKLGAGGSYDEASKDEGLAGDWRRLRRTIR